MPQVKHLRAAGRPELNGENKFRYVNPHNFVVTIGSISFGLIAGKPFTNAKFPSIQEELSFMRGELLFERGLAERLERYVEVLERQVDPRGKQ